MLDNLLETIDTRIRPHLWRILYASSPPRWLLQPCGHANQILLRSNSLIAEAIYCRIFEHEEEKFLLNNIQKGMTVFDIGANIGWITIIMAQAVGPQGRVHSFEPYPPIFNHLQLNIALNELSQVSANCLALGNTSGVIPFYIFPEGFEVYNSIGAGERREGQSAHQKINVPVTQLDHYCQENHISQIDLIKIDVEGAEEIVLKGASRILKENPQVIIMMELFEPSAKQCGCSIYNCLKMLLDFGFYPYYLNQEGNLQLLTVEECKIIVQGQNLRYNFIFKQPQ